MRTGSARFESRQRRKDVGCSISTFARASCRRMVATSRASCETSRVERHHTHPGTRSYQLEAVRAVAEEITRERDLSRFLTSSRRALALVGAGGGYIYLWNDADQVLVPRAWTVTPSGCLSVGCGSTSAWRGSGRPAGRPDRQRVPRWPAASRFLLERTGVTAALAEPLVCRDNLVG